MRQAVSLALNTWNELDFDEADYQAALNMTRARKGHGKKKPPARNKDLAGELDSNEKKVKQEKSKDEEAKSGKSTSNGLHSKERLK